MHRYVEGFHPEPARYDIIWIQWCVGHLTDEDFVSFFQRCAAGLKPGGLIMVKENNAKEGFILDTDDSSLTRSHKYLMHLFEDALGYKVVEHRYGVTNGKGGKGRRKGGRFDRLRFDWFGVCTVRIMTVPIMKPTHS